VDVLAARLASRADTVPPPNPSFVILKRCCLGDVLETTACVDAIRRRYPMARIDYATEAYSRPSLAGNPDLDNVVDPTLASLKRGGYDVAITLERSPAIALLPWLARIPIRVGPNNMSRGFAHNVRIACPAERSEAEIALDCAAAIDVPVDGARPRFCPSPDEAAEADRLLAGAGLSDASLLAVAPGGGVNPGMRLIAKRWPSDRFAALAAQLRQEHGLQAILLGGSDDREAAFSPAIDFIGRASFGQTAALVRRSRLLVGNDSAPLHLSAAVGTPFVGIFGPSDPLRHRPLGKGEIVAAPIARQAYRNGFADVDCIDMVSVEDVLAACLRLLDSE
jgi:ADP-heptose:LPS heptosyltransferase